MDRTESHKSYYDYGVPVEIAPSALNHGITREEILEVVEHPLVTYGIQARGTRDADLHRYVGDPNVLIEVVAEHIDSDTTVVFHAMTLRSVVAREVLAHTGGAINLLDEVTPQRR